MDLITATYLATRPDRDPEELAENIAREQSLELVRELIPDAIAERLLGQVLAVDRLDQRRWALKIGYPAELASGRIGQLLHLLYGNVSFYPRIRLTGLALPDELLDELAGPRAGIDGIRQWISVFNRPLLATVLKPRGSEPEYFAGLARRFARAGGDILKDDQNLIERDTANFRRRVSACARAVEAAADETGRRCLYLPHVAGSGDFLHARLEIVAGLGLRGVVMCPWVMGLETAAAAAREFDLMWLAHPAMAGSFTEADDHGVSTAVMLGMLVRIAGADISIFPGSGGRIASHHEPDEAETCHALTRPLGQLKAALPCTGGGKTLELAPETARRLGNDCAVLVGGDLLSRGERMEASVASVVSRLNAD